MVNSFRFDVVIIGGCGHVGLPLGIALADQGRKVALYDINEATVKTVNDGELPFREDGADAPLRAARAADTLVATTQPEVISEAECVVVVVGTPVDEFLSPNPQAIPRAINQVGEYLRDGQLLVLRSTVYPGVTTLVERAVAALGHDIDIAFCPERIAEGKAMTELRSLPQLVAARTPRAQERAATLFRTLTDSIVPLAPEEAELAKLFTNTWRYIKFATANQFYMLANDAGLDFTRIRDALMLDYPRAADLPMSGFAAGPCLFKDAMQLAAFSNNNFPLGHAAMLVNEGLPLYIASRLAEKYDLENMTVGILGMAFKGESDDIRSSLSYKLRRVLLVKAGGVLCTDPYVDDARLVSHDEVIAGADLLIVGAPHRAYADLQASVPIVDVWNLRGDGVLV
ncbi:nucleotide sugar dehydrogenase [uncultured Jatrophihabitans sp.]|uniref:nucleotide sugar dehydrogenase n=1 Tax=uncultured Jatrophihabitans sp. TaxID=1610747 RepID=UPI0035CB4560